MENHKKEKNNIDPLERKHKYLIDWLENIKSAQEIAPDVQREKEITKWQFEARRNLPDAASEIPMARLEDQLNRDFNHLKSNLPMIPEYDDSSFFFTTGPSTATSGSIFEIVSRTGDIDTPETKAYAEKYIKRYQDLQKNHSRAEEVRKLISNLGNHQTLERFHKARKAAELIKTEAVTRTSAANEIRNLLHGVKGDLIEKARKWKKENMPWKKMSNRLAVGEIELEELDNQEKVHGSLLVRLADVAKDREGGSITNLEFIWTQVLDHIYTILVLTK